MKKYKMFPILFVLSAVLLFGCAGNDGKEADASKQTTEAETAPADTQGDFSQDTEPGSERDDSEADGIVFQSQDLDGNEVSSAAFSDSKLTMVNVWATYCNPCLREMPGLGELASEYDAGEFQIIGVISDVMDGSDQEMLEVARDLVAQTGADYPHLLLNESLYYALLTDVTAVPTTFFVNENGEILDTVVGSMEKSNWEDKINALLEEV